jgi:hypothetical protein
LRFEPLTASVENVILIGLGGSVELIDFSGEETSMLLFLDLYLYQVRNGCGKVDAVDNLGLLDILEDL